MSDLSVPTIQVEAELVWLDGRQQRGTIFLPGATALHTGTQLPREWIDEPAQFFALLPAGSDTAVLVSKQALACLSVAARSDEQEAQSAATLRSVAVSIGERQFRGQLLIDLPEHSRRTIDLLNDSSASITLLDRERHHLIRKAAITQVVDLAE